VWVTGLHARLPQREHEYAGSICGAEQDMSRSMQRVHADRCMRAQVMMGRLDWISLPSHCRTNETRAWPGS
jgi:hypothetical protein